MATPVLWLLALSALLAAAESRGDLFQGASSGAKLIHHEVYEKYAIPFIKRDEDVEVKTSGNELIKAITVSDLKGDSESYVKRGGLGFKDVTIRLKSARGEGYKFLVEIYAL